MEGTRQDDGGRYRLITGVVLNSLTIDVMLTMHSVAHLQALPGAAYYEEQRLAQQLGVLRYVTFPSLLTMTAQRLSDYARATAIALHPQWQYATEGTHVIAGAWSRYVTRRQPTPAMVIDILVGVPVVGNGVLRLYGRD